MEKVVVATIEVSAITDTYLKLRENVCGCCEQEVMASKDINSSSRRMNCGKSRMIVSRTGEKDRKVESGWKGRDKWGSMKWKEGRK